MMSVRLSVVAMVLSLAFNGIAAEKEASVFQRPFFASSMEVEPGGTLMLQPKLPYVEGLADGKCSLVLDFPEEIRLGGMELPPIAIDGKGRVEASGESVRTFVEGGRNRTELTCKFDLSQALEGTALYFGYDRGGAPGHMYVPVLKFSGIFDWRAFRAEVRIPAGVEETVPLLLKWGNDPSRTETLLFKSLQIKEADTGKVAFDFHPGNPVVMKMTKGRQTTCRLSEDASKTGAQGGGDKLKLSSGKLYVLECQAKGEGVATSLPAFLKEAMSGRILYTRPLLFDVDEDLSMPDKLRWRIERSDGGICRKGEIALVPAKDRATTQKLDVSAWICETTLQKQDIAVQKLYVGKLHSWGMNAIEPTMATPSYGSTISDESVAIPAALEAKRLGMRVRAYANFVYGFDKALRMWLDGNPQFAGVGPLGKRLFWAPVCPTFYLEAGNPWLKYNMDAITRSVEVNGLDGVFYDFEINAAPYRRHTFGNVALPATPRKWNTPCICERCRKAFQTSVKLDHVPSVEECCGDALYDKWTDFRCRQNVELWKRTRQAAKAGDSDATFAIYSGQADNYTRQTYGVDWTMGALCLDFAMLRRFSPFPKRLSNELNAALMKGVPVSSRPPKRLFQLGVFAYGDQWVDERKAYSELPNLKLDIVRTVALCGSYGWSFNGIWNMDDQLSVPFKEANALLAKYEDFFVDGAMDGALVEVAVGDVETATWQLGDRYVTFVFNRKGSQEDVGLKMMRPAQLMAAALKVGAHDCIAYEWPVASRSWYNIFSW